jgi:hypothetical protein
MLDKWTDRYLKDRFGYDEMDLNQMISKSQGMDDYYNLYRAVDDLEDGPYKKLMENKLFGRYLK